MFCVCVLCMLACFWDSNSFWKGVFRLILSENEAHFFPNLDSAFRGGSSTESHPPCLLKKPEHASSPFSGRSRLVLGEAEGDTVPSGTGAQRPAERGGLEMEVTWGTPVSLGG